MTDSAVNPNLQFLRDCFDDPNIRIYKCQGGTRSGKTYSILMYLIEICFLYPNAGIEIDIVRKTLPSLKATAYKDFLELLESFGAYDVNCHNMTELIYVLNGNIFNFYSLDQSLKVRGRKRHILYLNEGNEIDLETYRQMSFRTTHKIIIDYNPHDAEHWVYDLSSRPDCRQIITTYKDNPHLTPGQILEIELLKDTDPDYWNIFGMGQIGSGMKGRIYTHFQQCDTMPDYNPFYGLDFGFNDPLALYEIQMHNDTIWTNEIIYKPGLTMDDVDKVLKDKKIKSTIYADSAGAEQIARLQKLGHNVIAAKKGKDSIQDGIKLLKQYKIFYTYTSAGMHKEQLHYKWEIDNLGNPTDKPADKFNHAMDCLRYGVTSRLGNRSRMKAFAC